MSSRNYEHNYASAVGGRFNPDAFPALVLNADYRPVSVHPLKALHWHDSLRDVMAGRVDVIEVHPVSVRTAGGLRIALPAVVALRRYQSLDRSVSFTRLGVYLRDRFQCAYCGERKGMRDLTFDHVVPSSKGGKTTWLNIITACTVCNLAKGDKSPEQARMPLRFKPYVPTRAKLNDIARDFPPPMSRLHRAWLPWLGIEVGEEVLTATETALSYEGDVTNPAFPQGLTDDAYWHAELEE